MAYGEHWEWRAFGDPEAASDGFAALRARFESLPALFPAQEVTDRYLWMRGLRLNAKLRVGAEDGLKLKRRLDAAGEVERWLEDPDEVFSFPLDRRAWERLALGLGLAGFDGAALPARPTDLEESLRVLRAWDADVRIVEVEKRRQARRIETAAGPVKVEWAAIERPERSVSIGLEEWAEGETGEDSEVGLAAVRGARASLDLASEALRPLSYLDAVEVWARGGSLFDVPPPAVGASPGAQ